MILVLDMQDRRPAWAMPDWVPARLRQALGALDLPPDAPREVRHLTVPADGSGDGTARAHPEVLAAVRDAHAYLGYGIPAEVLEAGERLRWVHSGAAGVGGSLHDAMMASDVVFTNSAGIHGPPMAETVLGMILHFARGLDFAVEGGRRGRWETEPFYRAPTPVRELGRSTVGVLGLGGVGREVAARCAALGARVLATRRRGDGRDHVDLEAPGGARLPGAVRLLSGDGALDALLAESDYLVLTAPETDETRGVIDAEALRRMPDHAVLINVSRGGLVDEGALVDGLREGRLRGAALDVVSREPLPADHPLWGFPNVLITPHVSAVTDAYWERETALIVHNLQALHEGRPLRNVVDRERGY